MMIMSNENQYLRPDYLSPLPSLDAKNSPLALLAQTCSQIGADVPTKLNGNHNDKNHNTSTNIKKTGNDSRDKRSPSLSSAASSSSCSNSGSPTNRVSATSVSTTRSSFKPYESCVVKPVAEPATVATSISLDATIRRATPLNDRCSSKESSSSRKSPIEDKKYESKSVDTNPITVTPVTSTAASYHPHHHLSLAASPMMNPYFRAAAAGPLPCRDPYCTGCQLAAQLAGSAGKPPCPAGCVQCEPKSHQPHHHPQHHSMAAAAFAHAQLAALAAAANQLPYVCSWMAASADLPSYCGKRFGTSDELLQHLRTHTSDPAAALPLLQRSYPTPPLSPSTSRYHPYAAKHHSTYFAAAGYPSPLTLPPHPSLLPPYFPTAYSPYAPRLSLGTSPHT
ncbi:zinc finger protein Elbow-like [Daktulosphaira vitifoliae]|uniref:zinc finger protein Elbow-like n=1 Tax=Daktulosphaira vitifoliae TaxID=58002 RepID=UPI0021AAC4E2|nr:zinc finger protein Elbow-like [Daktulosphaira vitifoliae]